MINKAGGSARFIASDNRRVLPVQTALIRSIWDIEVFRRKLHGSTYHWDKVGQSLGNCNTVTNEGLNALLNIMFHGATQITTWYIEIFESDTTPAAGTTYAVPVYTPCSAYTEATRPEYVEAAASGQSMTNAASKATYTMNNTKTVYGAALVGGGTAANTKADTAGGGTLYAGAKFSIAQACVSSDIIQVACVLTAADA